MNMQDITINTEFIRLDSLLKLASLVSAGGEAKHFIQNGLVTLNDEICTQRAKKIRPGDIVSFAGESIRVIAEESSLQSQP